MCLYNRSFNCYIDNVYLPALTAFLKEHDFAIFGYRHWFTAFHPDVWICNSLTENARFGVDIHLVVVDAEA